MTASRPEPVLPIDVLGELRLAGPVDGAVTLTAEGPRLSIAAPCWNSLNRLGPRSVRAQRRTLARAGAALRTLGLTLDVRIDGRRVFGIGEGVRPTLIARLLGLASTSISFSTVLQLLRSRIAMPHADPR